MWATVFVPVLYCAVLYCVVLVDVNKPVRVIFNNHIQQYSYFNFHLSDILLVFNFLIVNKAQSEQYNFKRRWYHRWKFLPFPVCKVKFVNKILIKLLKLKKNIL